MPRILSISDLMLLPSETESFGLVALEGMACEVPVVASSVGGVPRSGSSHEKDGFLAPVGDLDGMAAGRLRCFRMTRSGRRWALYARQHAQDSFSSPQKIITRYEVFYEQVIREVQALRLFDPLRITFRVLREMRCVKS